MLTTSELITATDAIVYPSHPGRTVRAEYEATLLTYQQECRELEKEWELCLAQEHLDKNVPAEVADALYRQAFNSGHDSGYNEIAYLYKQFATLVNLTVRALS